MGAISAQSGLRSEACAWQADFALTDASRCDAALTASCGREHAADVFSCAQCAGDHRHTLVDREDAACDNDRVSRW